MAGRARPAHRNMPAAQVERRQAGPRSGQASSCEGRGARRRSGRRGSLAGRSAPQPADRRAPGAPRRSRHSGRHYARERGPTTGRRTTHGFTIWPGSALAKRLASLDHGGRAGRDRAPVGPRRGARPARAGWNGRRLTSLNGLTGSPSGTRAGSCGASVEPRFMASRLFSPVRSTSHGRPCCQPGNVHPPRPCRRRLGSRPVVCGEQPQGLDEPRGSRPPLTGAGNSWSARKSSSISTVGGSAGTVTSGEAFRVLVAAASRPISGAET